VFVRRTQLSVGASVFLFMFLAGLYALLLGSIFWLVVFLALATMFGVNFWRGLRGKRTSWLANLIMGAILLVIVLAAQWLTYGA
jgi:hypothetical protein